MTVTTASTLDDVTVAVSGQGGDGSLTVITLLGRILSARGFHLYSARNVASRIKGGHAAAMVRGSHAYRGGLDGSVDLLVAFDQEAVERIGPSMAAGGIVVFDGSGGALPAGSLPDGMRVFEVPFARMAVRDLRRDLYKNSLAFGVLTRVLSVPDAEAEARMVEGLGRLPAALQEVNRIALHHGFAYADDQGIPDGGGVWALEATVAPERLLITGNEALALGFLVAGGRFFTGYPITPASEILESLQRHLPRFGGVTVQAEDELSAVNMAIGAALTGVRAMTATSGPGLALMQEGIGHAGSAEVPLVIVDCQRAGPSTGMPTKPEQSDLAMLVHGGNGEFPRVVLAPGGAADCFELAVAGVGIARRLQCPVYIALDQAIAQHAETVAPFDLDVPVEGGAMIGGHELAARAEYRRYLVTADGVSPWVVPGTPGGMNLVTGNEHNEWGQVSIDPENRRTMMAKRARKLTAAAGDLPRAVRWGSDDAEVGVIGFGFTVAPMREAVERLADLGVPVAGLQPRTLWPVPAEVVDFVRAHRVTFVVEHNDEGQLLALLVAAGAPLDRVRGIRRCDGLAFTPGELVERIVGEVGR
ncbi:MAG TPA: 2-oxoacid:acceptor oxidoreductase subunit alpha [Acidimicrobiia bacterium]|nr:2-oxoacid:acceptor oxidoreductase subunit alpha [Acidimicrobiia bacterium]